MCIRDRAQTARAGTSASRATVSLRSGSWGLAAPTSWRGAPHARIGTALTSTPTTPAWIRP
eukprot:4791906-Alexandrium_andersonii.AAC.1